jgi:hypothetical protein
MTLHHIAGPMPLYCLEHYQYRALVQSVLQCTTIGRLVATDVRLCTMSSCVHGLVCDRITHCARRLSDTGHFSRSCFWPVLLKHLHHFLNTCKIAIATKSALKKQITACTDFHMSRMHCAKTKSAKAELQCTAVT